MWEKRSCTGHLSPPCSMASILPCVRADKATKDTEAGKPALPRTLGQRVLLRLVSDNRDLVGDLDSERLRLDHFVHGGRQHGGIRLR